MDQGNWRWTGSLFHVLVEAGVTQSTADLFGQHNSNYPTEVFSMEILEGIKTRRSIRAFKPKSVTQGVMKKILQAASKSPSYTNTQPWEVVVVSGEKKNELSRRLTELAKAKAPSSPDLPMPKSWPQALEERSREHGARRLSTLGMARDDEEGREKLRLMNFEFYGAPCTVLLFMDG
jgi:nitroreductase